MEAKVSAKGLPALRAFRSNLGSRGVEAVLETFLKNLKKCLVVRVVGNVDQAIESNNKKGVILQFI